MVSGEWLVVVSGEYSGDVGCTVSKAVVYACSN